MQSCCDCITPLLLLVGVCYLTLRPKALYPMAPSRLDHAYNDPTLTPIEFLRRVMHDTSLPLPTRLDAAAKLGEAELQSPPPVRCTIHIDTMFLSPTCVVSRADML